MEFLLLTVGCFVFPFLHISFLYFVKRTIPGRSKGLYFVISQRLVSLFQALFASCVGLQVILRCEDVMKERFLSINYYTWFGVSYFYYDIGAMFLGSYHSFPNQNLKEIYPRFFAKNWLIVLHHIFVPLFGFPIIVFYRRGLGDFFVGCIFFAEVSTPFVSIHAILKQLDMQRSRIFKVNGCFLATSFFLGRILIFPYMYHNYANYSKISTWQVPLKIPLLCNISCLGLLTLQLFWFSAILRQGFAFLNISMRPISSREEQNTKSGITKRLTKDNFGNNVDSNFNSNGKGR
ncbi:protein FAM57A-like [Dendronephthya gigantea]|uniref:protein FAM57A-like n=1 Tax=Dendronephthya gigantea TaxID=151771 RepID=UPI00106B72E1|nr:protein FAM57A-like [Dendronephthya gigantea]